MAVFDVLLGVVLTFVAIFVAVLVVILLINLIYWFGRLLWEYFGRWFVILLFWLAVIAAVVLVFVWLSNIL